MTQIYTGISKVQILEGARELTLLQYIQIRSSNQSANLSFFCSSAVARMDSLTTRVRLESNLKISGAVPPLNLSPIMAQSGTILFYHNHLHMSISLKKLHSLWCYKGTFLDNIYLLNAHYTTHLFHLH